MKFAKALTGEFADFFRFRVGDYRVVFSRSQEGLLQIVNVSRIGHRKHIYE